MAMLMMMILVVMAFGAGYTCAEEGGSQVAKAKGRL